MTRMSTLGAAWRWRCVYNIKPYGSVSLWTEFCACVRVWQYATRLHVNRCYTRDSVLAAALCFSQRPLSALSLTASVTCTQWKGLSLASLHCASDYLLLVQVFDSVCFWLLPWLSSSAPLAYRHSADIIWFDRMGSWCTTLRLWFLCCHIPSDRISMEKRRWFLSCSRWEPYSHNRVDCSCWRQLLIKAID